MVFMAERLSVLCWNVRGLNDRARRTVVRSMVYQCKCSILCLQESKLDSFSDEDRTDIGGSLLQGAVSMPALGTRGGMIILWDKSQYTLSDVAIREFSISALVKPLDGCPWTITSVYGPHDDRSPRQDLIQVRHETS